jgi:hypothetical protein
VAGFRRAVSAFAIVRRYEPHKKLKRNTPDFFLTLKCSIIEQQKRHIDTSNRA